MQLLTLHGARSLYICCRGEIKTMKVRNTLGNLWEFSLGMWIHVRKEIILVVFSPPKYVRVCFCFMDKWSSRGTGIDGRVLIVCGT